MQEMERPCSCGADSMDGCKCEMRLKLFLFTMNRLERSPSPCEDRAATAARVVAQVCCADAATSGGMDSFGYLCNQVIEIL